MRVAVSIRPVAAESAQVVNPVVFPITGMADSTKLNHVNIGNIDISRNKTVFVYAQTQDTFYLPLPEKAAS